MFPFGFPNKPRSFWVSTVRQPRWIYDFGSKGSQWVQCHLIEKLCMLSIGSIGRFRYLKKNVEPIKIQPPSHVMYIIYIYIYHSSKTDPYPCAIFGFPWRFRQHFERSALPRPGPGPGGSVGRGSHVPRGWSHLRDEWDRWEVNVPRYPTLQRNSRIYVEFEGWLMYL